MSIERAEELHNQAMEYADRALSSRLAEKVAEARNLLRLAFEREQSAADTIAELFDLEPTRSVLHRSAATMAMELGESATAERLLHRALAGSPPERMGEDLRDLLEQVTFQRHLELRGIELRDDEVQMAIAGKAVGLGIAPTDEFISRVSNTEKLLFRIAERRSGKAYREHGRATPGLQRDLELFLSVPRAASFSVTFKIGGSTQLALPGMDFAKAVVDDLLEELELFNQADESKLRNRIPDPAYFRNFTALARAIAPDGVDISTVGFTAMRAGKKREVALLKGSRPITETPAHPVKGQPPATFVGRLKAADATREGKNQIKLISDRPGKPQTIVVPPGMMSDIVRPMWDEIVRVRVKRKRGVLELLDIEKVRPKQA
jgi:tetratricopeptide (TPR) repeat protein